MFHDAYIAFGSNLGDRSANIQKAAAALNSLGQMKRVSPILEYPAVDSPAGSPAFLNGVLHLQTELTPRELLDGLLNIELQIGRKRSVRNAPRIIDLDLLMYDQVQSDAADLQLPHPRMHERRFVLEPFCVLAPDLIHPRLNKSIQQLFSELP
ncbi:MAG TPA: 2-amino-4-hydroxy-6-hydroxymethyldihydropteridine diphosphokinase [Tepidisphaeraceae bacterium]|jgi:2-amino-4-hydroxy-6-hydroxymethyldihydropteridine diphosphokinase